MVSFVVIRALRGRDDQAGRVLFVAARNRHVVRTTSAPEYSVGFLSTQFGTLEANSFHGALGQLDSEACNPFEAVLTQIREAGQGNSAPFCAELWQLQADLESRRVLVRKRRIRHNNTAAYHVPLYSLGPRNHILYLPPKVTELLRAFMEELEEWYEQQTGTAQKLMATSTLHDDGVWGAATALTNFSRSPILFTWIDLPPTSLTDPRQISWVVLHPGDTHVGFGDWHARHHHQVFAFKACPTMRVRTIFARDNELHCKNGADDEDLEAQQAS